MGCSRNEGSVAGGRLLSESVRRAIPLARTNTDMTKDSRAMSGGGFRRAVLGLVAILMSLGVGLGITRILEWGAGWRLYASHRNAGLIWGPYSVVEHATEEFSYQARINNLGFRDRDFAVRRSPARRVLAIGDSFTYGWGVYG